MVSDVDVHDFFFLFFFYELKVL